MSIKLFKKKPVIIKALQWDGSNLEEVKSFIGDDFISIVTERRMNGRSDITIKTLEGQIIASKGDWIIEGVKGEHYPCKPDIFAESYEETK